MAESIDDYLLDHDGVDWPEALGAWAWLVPDQFTIWLVTRFGDLVVIEDDGSVHRLDVVRGTFTRLADDREGFRQQIVERLTVGQARTELRGLAAKLLVAERLDCRLECVDVSDAGAKPLQFAVVLRADDFGEELAKH